MNRPEVTPQPVPNSSGTRLEAWSHRRMRLDAESPGIRMKGAETPSVSSSASSGIDLIDSKHSRSADQAP